MQLFNFRNLLSTSGTKTADVSIPLKKEGVLSKIVEAEEVTMSSSPFRYFVADNFFTPDYYEQLVQVFDAAVHQGLAETPHQLRFSRMGAYDAYGYTPSPYDESPINHLRTPEWIELFQNAFAIDVTQDEIMGFHHHPVDSADGWKHNDYALCSMVDDPLLSGVNSWYYQCDYEDSDFGKQIETRKIMRAITIIYYLNNECSGEHGGETALFDTEGNAVAKVAPVNNRLLAFEVSPYSFHTFLRNTKFPRNSITQWFHQNPELMYERFGNHEPVRW